MPPISLPLAFRGVYGVIFVACDLLWYGLEGVAVRTKRIRAGATNFDRGSKQQLIVTFWLGLILGVLCALVVPKATITLHQPVVFTTGIVCILAGVVLRWYAIATFGRRFHTRPGRAAQPAGNPQRPLSLCAPPLLQWNLAHHSGDRIGADELGQPRRDAALRRRGPLPPGTGRRAAFGGEAGQALCGVHAADTSLHSVRLVAFRREFGENGGRAIALGVSWIRRQTHGIRSAETPRMSPSCCLARLHCKRRRDRSLQRLTSRKCWGRWAQLIRWAVRSRGSWCGVISTTSS